MERYLMMLTRLVLHGLCTGSNFVAWLLRRLSRILQENGHILHKDMCVVVQFGIVV